MSSRSKASGSCDGSDHEVIPDRIEAGTYVGGGGHYKGIDVQ